MTWQTRNGKEPGYLKMQEDSILWSTVIRDWNKTREFHCSVNKEGWLIIRHDNQPIYAEQLSMSGGVGVMTKEIWEDKCYWHLLHKHLLCC